MIKAILFDLDGIVINSEPLYEKVEHRLFEQYGISIPEEDQRLFKGTTETEFYDLVEDKYQPDWDRQQVMREGRRLLIDAFTRDLQFMPGFLSLVDRVRERYLMGLVTSTQGDLFNEICRLLPIREIFQEFVCADDISNGKPHPDPYLTMMKKFQVAPGSVIVIEDSIHGIASAKAAGALCVALASSFPKDELRTADVVVESLDEINDALMDELVRRRDSLSNKRPQVILRPIDESDLDFWGDLLSQPEACEHQPLAEKPAAELQEQLKRYSEPDLSHPIHREYKWVVRDKATGEKIGMVSFDRLDLEQKIGRIGYTISRESWGKGYGTGAVAELTRKIFSESNTERIEAECSINNPASSRVLENNGFGLEGIKRKYLEIRGHRVDHFSFGLLRSDWEKRIGNT